MKINSSMSFPYPVLGRRGIDSEADVNMEAKIQDDFFIWDFDIIHDNEDIDELVRSGKVKYSCEVDCQDTFYRNAFYPEIGGDERHIQVKIKNTEIGGRLNIAVTALAVEAIAGYRNSRSTGFYSNYAFDLEPGDMLAIFGGWDIDLDIAASSYKRITSILQLHFNSEVNELEVNLNDKKQIIIELPSEKYEPYEAFLKNTFYQPALLSSLAFEAFSRAIQQLPEHESLTWARVLENRAQELGYEDVKQQLKEDPDLAFELTRKILEEPYCKLFDLINELGGTDSSQDS